MFRQVIEAAPDAMVIVDDCGQIVVLTPAQARDVAMDLLQRVRTGSTVTSNGRRSHISASVGVALFGGGGGFDLTSVLANADVAMYQAKGAGRNRVTLFEPSKSQRAELRGLDAAPYGF